MRKAITFIVSLVLLFSALSVGAQNLLAPHSNYDYDFIIYDSSYLYSPKGNPNLEVFFDKLDRMYFDGEDDVTILHLGGSHVQGGVWSWRLRRHFESLCHDVDGDFGILFPFSIGKTNHPYYYVSKSTGNWKTEKITKNESGEPIGLAGMVAYTSDSLAELSFQFTKASMKGNHKFTRAILIHGENDTCYDIRTNADSLLVGCETDFVEGYTEFLFSQPMDSLSFTFVRNDTVVSAMHVYGVLIDDAAPNVKFVNIGVNGASTESYLNAGKFFSQLDVVNPDLAILSVGVNDASGGNFSKEKYISNYKRIVDEILRVNPNCAIIFTTNNDFYNYRGGVNLNQPKVCEAMRELSSIYSASMWNMYNVMGGYKSIQTWYKNNLAKKDKIHFTPEGYNIIGDLLFDAILHDYEKHLRNVAEKETKFE